MYEDRYQPVLPRALFIVRLVRHAALGLGIIAVCLAIGMLGYHFLENLQWIDAFTNAAMILSGMGPLDPLKTHAGKLFAGTYALFSGIMFLGTIGLFLAPVAHRMLHKFHLVSSDRS